MLRPVIAVLMLFAAFYAGVEWDMRKWETTLMKKAVEPLTHMGSTIAPATCYNQADCDRWNANGGYWTPAPVDPKGYEWRVGKEDASKTRLVNLKTGEVVGDIDSIYSDGHWAHAGPMWSGQFSDSESAKRAVEQKLGLK